MSAEKKRIVESVRERRTAALRVLVPQWHRCWRTRPFGHIRDGTRSRSHHYEICLYCGKPSNGGFIPLNDLERAAAEIGRYPIANEIPKGAMA